MLEVGLPLHVVRQGDDDDPDVIAVTDDSLKVLEPSGDRTLISELLDDGSADDQDGNQERDDDDRISLR